MTQLTDTNGDTVIRLKNLWEWVFKLFLLSAPMVAGAAFYHLRDMNIMLNHHEKAVGEMSGGLTKLDTDFNKLEHRVNDNGLRDDSQDKEILALSKATSEIKGKLQGIASQVGKLPGRVAEKLAQDEQDN